MLSRNSAVSGGMRQAVAKSLAKLELTLRLLAQHVRAVRVCPAPAHLDLNHARVVGVLERFILVVEKVRRACKLRPVFTHGVWQHAVLRSGSAAGPHRRQMRRRTGRAACCASQDEWM
eukprot:350593-Chlamydomonas_euryale.AAC.7